MIINKNKLNLDKVLIKTILNKIIKMNKIYKITFINILL